ncbi:PHB depolymerase family esterase [Spirillospora sp. NPDC029432]|uniref:alpha/beta hydrolase family esterase n=1 Tax=Spirillospora sp. NPDC029432 TaxID=3154599 RepID=UPI003456AB69
MRLACAVLVCALLSGCTGGTAGDGSPPPRRGAPGTAAPSTSAPAAAASPSEGCGKRAADGRGTFGGRSYLLKLPAGYGRSPAPLIVDLHGLHSTAFQQALYSRVANAGAARGFIVVEPGGAPGRAGWKLPGMPGGSADVAYVGELLDHLESTLCVDRSREYATGFSNGAGLAMALVCGLRGRLAGVGAVAGSNLARPCADAPPTRILAFHGTADRIVPYGGGEPFGGDRSRIPAWMRPADGAFALPSVTALAGGWARALGCGAGERSRPASRIVRLSHPGCEGGARVELYTVNGGGHTWPGSFPIGDAGETTDQIDATKIILDAFAAAR